MSNSSSLPPNLHLKLQALSQDREFLELLKALQARTGRLPRYRLSETGSLQQLEWVFHSGRVAGWDEVKAFFGIERDNS